MPKESSNFSNGTFHLTITRRGLVSLWDSETQAQSITDEAYVALHLTKDQVSALRHAAGTSKR